MPELIRELDGGNMEIDLFPKPGLQWEPDGCPLNAAEGTLEHKCAVKDISICEYFRRVKPLDTILCTYPKSI